MRKAYYSQIKNINNRKIFLFILFITTLLITTIGTIFCGIIQEKHEKRVQERKNKLVDKIINIKTLRDELREEIGQNFNLKITNPNLGSIKILVSGYEKDQEPETLIPKFPEIDKDINIIQEFAKECISHFSENSELSTSESISESMSKSIPNQKIIFTGFGADQANNEFAILFSMLSDNKNNLTITNIHLIDPSYAKIIDSFSKHKYKSKDDLELSKSESPEPQVHNFNYLSIKDFKQIINYLYLLNKKLKTKNANSIRLFFHKNVQSYLKCLSICNLDKTNCLSVWHLPKTLSAEVDLMNFIKKGTSDNCLFFRKEVDRTGPKILNKESKNQYIKDLSQKKMQHPNKMRLEKEKLIKQYKEIQINKSSQFTKTII